MTDKIHDIVTDLVRGDISKDECVEQLSNLYSLDEKNRLDILNWARSELRQEVNQERIRFLKRIVAWLY